ncbi:pyrroline-5-carboxylate reductase 3 isoform X2 [Hemicordylus capensis]|uniref:pyrroline-5-carboxylate reductase 3 isoform X2 n=1 Tax=Hemicordylus capensis TaxID=884348 RepID=UPI0023042176|nr:pyrroline-5-carboxylate reductase 3 isoform X2 [Hemicordylus capensis]
MEQQPPPQNRENVASGSRAGAGFAGDLEGAMMGELRDLRVGFIGAGRMAGAVAQGLLLADLQRRKKFRKATADAAKVQEHMWKSALSGQSKREVQAENIFASAPSNRNLEKFQNHGCKTTHCNLQVVKNCTFLFLATKPYILPAVLQQMAPAVTPKHVVISMAAGVSLQSLEELLPAGTKVLRVMLNLPCEVQSGAILLAQGSCAGEQDVALLKRLLSPCGLVEEAPESYLDIHTGLSGSGVAYVYTFAEALAEGAVKMGMPGDMAYKMAAQTLLGGAKMILETGEHPAVLRSAVCTPGGTTIHALHELEKGTLRATVMNAVEAATTRARELGKR